MQLLAHRGLWRSPGEKNTRAAFRDAFSRGFGVELDVRDQEGRLVIAHDLPVGPCMAFADVLQDYQDLRAVGTIAINIKADGLVGPLAAEVGAAALLDRCFVFDMSVPDLVTYLPTSLPVFHRRSEIEPASALATRTAGVWLDFFQGNWVDLRLAAEELWAGRSVAIVSPELHKKPYRESWSALRALIDQSGLPRDLVARRLMLCTDFPEEAAEFFALQPPGDRP